MGQWHLEQVVDRLMAFRKERDWAQFHRPKELAAGLAIEAAELQELFLWREGETADEVRADPERMAKIRDEVADVANFVLMLAHDLDIDLADACERKIDKNAVRYNAAEHRGIAKKAE